MKQLFFDIETLGQKSDSVCFLASFLVYDIVADKELSLEELEPKVKTFKLSIAEQYEAGRKSTKSTMDWWKGQLKIAPHLGKMLEKSPDDLTMKDFFKELEAWLKKEGYNKKKDFAWQRGTIDIMIIDDMARMSGLHEQNHPILWYKVREIRTALDLLGDTNLDGYIVGFKDNIKSILPGFTKHNPAHDILLEVWQMRKAEVFG